MPERTLRGEKLRKAREFCRANPEIGASIKNWWKLGYPSLYAALSVLGVTWSIEEKKWGIAAPQRTAKDVKIKSTSPALSPTSELVLIRIMADRRVIDKAVAEVVEIAQASDMSVDNISDAYSSDAGEWVRVYLRCTFCQTER